MNSEDPICDLNDTWEDITSEFKESLRECSTWKCFSVEGVNKESILSAPEIMDPQTDTGFGYQAIHSLKHLLKTGEIPPPSSFADDKSLVDLMDYIHVQELHFLQCYSLVQSYLAFPYFLHLDALQSANPTMYAYCRGMLRSLDSMLRITFATSIRGDEEFMGAPPELDAQLNMNVEEVLEELESAAAKASPAVALRLRWRKNFLRALHTFQEGRTREEMERACELCIEAREWLQSAPEYQRTDEPVVNPKLLRDKEVQFWVSVITPTRTLPLPPFAEAMEACKTMLTQLASLKSLFSLPTLNNVTEFIQDFGAQSPLLLVRCVAVAILFCSDSNESFLFGPPLHQRLLETLSQYGAPLYMKVFEENRDVVESVVRYRVQKTLDPTKVTPQQLEGLRQHTIETMKNWVGEACKQYLIHLEIMLCNRGLAHRRLMNVVPGLADFQKVSYYTDANIFLFQICGCNPRAEQDATRISMVLTLWSNTMVLRAIELIVKFQIELDLLKPGEIIPALWYLGTMHKAQNENMMLLAMQNMSLQIPENRVNKKRVPLYNLCFCTRTAGQVDPTELTLMEVNRLLADSQLFAACVAEKKGLMDFASTGSASLITAENIFNHRYFKCFRSIQSPQFSSYKHCIDTKPRIRDDSKGEEAKQASAMALSAAEKIRSLLQQPQVILWDSRRIMLERLERSARGLAACLMLLSDPSTTSERYECIKSTPGVPHYLSFPPRKKTA